jgi:hypothetical protein
MFTHLEQVLQGEKNNLTAQAFTRKKPCFKIFTLLSPLQFSV